MRRPGPVVRGDTGGVPGYIDWVLHPDLAIDVSWGDFLYYKLTGFVPDRADRVPEIAKTRAKSEELLSLEKYGGPVGARRVPA